MGLCFAVDLLVPKGADGRSRIEVLYEERWRLVSKVGISPEEWGRLTKWQRQDLLYRHHRDLQEQLKLIAGGQDSKGKLAGLVQVLVSRFLGV